MEAAEHFSPTEGVVRALDDRLLIERLEIADERAARIVRERAEAGQPGAETVRDAIEIGARVLEREGLASEVDYVRGEFERAAAQVREGFSDRARQVSEALHTEFQRVFGEEGGAMGRALESHADEIASQIAAHFGEESSSAVQHQIRELVTRSLEESRAELVRHFSSEDGRNPLADFKAAVNRTVTEAGRAQTEQMKQMGERLVELQTEIVRLGEQADARKRIGEVEERGTAKGRSFEERVFAVIDRIADGRGDVASHVGDERSDGGGKQGDVVVEVDAAAGKPIGRLVFEVKDEKLSKNRAWTVLNEAMAQREASFAVLVVAGDAKVPAGREALHEYEGNKMIVAVDAECEDELSLEVAYRYARCRLLMARDRDLSVDAAGVRDAAQEAISALKRAQKIRLALTAAGENVSKARSTLDEMAADVEAQLERIDALVAE